MSLADPIALSGSPGSPYTRKMLAVLRYRRLSYRMLLSSGPAAREMPQPKVRLLPTFYLPGASGELEAVVDSTPILKRLDAEIADRKVAPADPALAFIDELLEDYADEWLTKAMFHYRWAYAADVHKAGTILPNWSGVPMDDGLLAQMSQAFSARQISRLGVVGSNAVTGPVIEASYRRFLGIFERHLQVHPFLLGARPGAGDFGAFGQLTQLAQFDPTPMALTLEVAPRVYAWVSMMEDVSGLSPGEGDWISLRDPPATLLELLTEVGRCYQPVMLANAAALESGAQEVVAEVDGLSWRQQPFPYQAKCLYWLRASRGALPAESRAQVDALLGAAGCLTMFA